MLRIFGLRYRARLLRKSWGTDPLYTRIRFSRLATFLRGPDFETIVSQHKRAAKFMGINCQAHYQTRFPIAEAVYYFFFRVMIMKGYLQPS